MPKNSDHEKDLRRLAEFRMMDDDFMSAVFDSKPAETELLLKIILEKEDISVVDSSVQVSYTNLTERTIRLDILAKDRHNALYDIEIQRSDRGASAQRARFHSSMIDSKALKKGQEFTELPESYVIFITENDVIGLGLPLYHVDRTIREAKGAPFGDGSHIVYVNGAYENEEELIGQLIHDFHCKDDEDMYLPLLAERVRYLKKTEGGREYMCRLMEEMRDEKAIEIARNLLELGTLSDDDIAKATGLSLEKIKELSGEKTA